MTRDENGQYAPGHKPDHRGSRNPNHVLTEPEVRVIKRLLQSGVSPEEIADHYGVHVTTITKIRDNATWTHVRWPGGRPRKRCHFCHGLRTRRFAHSAKWERPDGSITKVPICASCEDAGAHRTGRPGRSARKPRQCSFCRESCTSHHVHVIAVHGQDFRACQSCRDRFDARAHLDHAILAQVLETGETTVSIRARPPEPKTWLTCGGCGTELPWHEGDNPGVDPCPTCAYLEVPA